MGKLSVLVQRLFPHPTTTRCLEALGWCDPIFDDELMWPSVRAAILPTLYMRSEKRDRLLTDEYDASRFVLSVIASYCEREVATGNWHIYRGTLSGQGRSLLSIAQVALSQLEEGDWLDYEDYRDRLEQLEDRVKDAG